MTDRNVNRLLDRVSILERANELLRYDEKTGKLFWRVARSNIKAGSVAGYVNKRNGYSYVGIDGKSHLAHRIVWLMVRGCWPAAGIDHIDGNPSNNRLENLREATWSDNQQNKGIQSDNKSGFTGVIWHKRHNKWQAYIKIDGKQKHLGLFDTKEDAAEAYAEAKAKHHTFNPEVVTRDGWSAEKAYRAGRHSNA